MTKLFSNKLALIFIGLLIAFFHLGAARAQTATSTAGKPTRRGQPVVKPSAESSNIVARIGDYAITGQELEKRLMTELRPRGYENYNEQAEPVDAETVLMKMIAEKAMVSEARKQDYLKDETFGASIKRFKEKRLSNLLLQKQLLPKINSNRVRNSTEDESRPQARPGQGRSDA